LPILEKKESILEAIRTHQVIIVAGETGSGKTTQLPVICLEAHRGIHGKIGCTQPRRIAAVSIAHRVAQELSCEVGREVGYKIRFGDHDTPQTCIKFMTDGILLAELEQQSDLAMYDTLIIDEAHERSLNIDFIIGYLRTLLPKRPDLKVIISSATIDTSLFSKAFNNAPVIEVSGRMFPVELLYLAEDTDDEEEFSSYVEDAVRAAEDLLDLYPVGDMLIFMPTERDIRETCNKLRGKKRPNVLVLPLFSRLSRSEQESIFSIIPERKVVVATNIAETSITVPGIKFVIDTGLARMSHYAARLRTNRLPIEPISQAAANQRMGRCGRVMDGVCIRLYSAKEFATRDPYTLPEIKRSNLAGVILSMIAHRLGTIETFPFLEPPSPAAIAEGYTQLQELGALDRHNRITTIGSHMARLPLDPHIARMVLAARQENALREVMVIAAALSIVDPRERPYDRQAEADEMHKRFTVPGSDFLSLYKLWEEYSGEWELLKTQNRMRKFCKEHFLSYTRMQEWHDVYTQIRESVIRMKGVVDAASPASIDAVHRSLLTGLLSNCAWKNDQGKFRGARGRELIIFPGSSVSGQKPDWIMCHEVIETSQVFAHTVAPIKPSWLEELAPHLCTRSYSEPWFDADTGVVRCTERVHLFGLPVAEHKGISFLRINPEKATEVFIRHALAEELLQNALPFYLHNKNIRAEIETLEAKMRTRSLFAGEEAIVAFYATRLQCIGSVHELNRCIKEHGSDEFLRMTKDDLLVSAIPETVSDYPDTVAVGGKAFPVKYTFAPGHRDDGITLKVNKNEASFITGTSLGYLVPSLWPATIAELLRMLPKEIRKQLMPLNEKATELANQMRATAEPFERNLAKLIRSLYRITIDESQLDVSRLPDHLSLRVEVIDSNGATIAEGRGAGVVKELFSGKKAVDTDWQQAFSRHRKHNLTSWNIGDLPEYVTVDSTSGGVPLYGYPALVDDAGIVNLEFFSTAESAHDAHVHGVRKLLEIACGPDIAWVEREIRFSPKLKLLCAPYGGADVIGKRLLTSLKNYLMSVSVSRPYTKEGFEALVAVVHVNSKGLAVKTMTYLESSLTLAAEIITRIKQHTNDRLVSVRMELMADAKVYSEEFNTVLPYERLAQFPRYLKAFTHRVERAFIDPGKYAKSRALLETVGAPIAAWEKAATTDTAIARINEYIAMVEEFAISLFAQQEVKTLFPVSEKRLHNKQEEIRMAFAKCSS